jgi:hypothetical protein
VLPSPLEDLIGKQDQFVFADFVVRPLTAERAGEMRMICVASATHIVTRRAYFIIDRPPRPN